MKRLLLFFIALSALSACEKNQDTLFFEETAEERMHEKLQELSDQLTGAEHGWIGYLTVLKTGGYGFYFQFNKDQKVRMYADLSTETASEAKESGYRFKSVMAPSIIFDTYSYITLLQDPDPGSFGGDAGKGYQSDIEFEYVRSTEDSIVLIGKKYRQDLILTRATSEEAEAYASGAYSERIDQINQFFIENNNAFLEVPGSGEPIQAQLDVDKVNKKVTLTGVLPDGGVVTSTQSFYYGLDGLYVTDSLDFEGVNFTKFTWSTPNALSGVDDTGETYALRNALIPVVPLYKLLGIKYSGLLSPYKTIFPGTTTKGEELLNYFHLNLQRVEDGSSVYIFNYGEIRFVWNAVNQRIELRGFSSQNGGSSGWTTTYTYDYTVDEAGIYTITHRSGPSGGYVATITKQIDDFLTNNRIQFDYYTDSGNLYGAMSSVDDPGIVMTFKLY